MGVRSRLLQSVEFVARLLPPSAKQAIYQNQLIANLVRSSLNLVAPEELITVKIASGAGENLQMELDLKTEKDYWLGTYESEVQLGISELVSSGDFVYDVGANIGFLTLLFARQTGPQGHVYAFEALPENEVRLTKNIKRNGFQDWVTVIPAAVMDRSEPVDFYIGPSTGMGKVQGSAGRDSVDYRESILVEGLSLDEYVERTGIPRADIVKIDIEGGEVLAVPGMRTLLQIHRPIVMIELHGPEAAKLCWEFLKHENYRICRMKSTFPEIHKYQDLDWKSYIVAFPNG